MSLVLFLCFSVFLPYLPLGFFRGSVLCLCLSFSLCSFQDLTQPAIMEKKNRYLKKKKKKKISLTLASVRRASVFSPDLCPESQFKGVVDIPISTCCQPSTLGLCHHQHLAAIGRANQLPSFLASREHPKHVELAATLEII